MYCTDLYCCQLWFNSTNTKSSVKKLSTAITVFYAAFLGFVNRTVPVFQHLLNCCANLFTGLHNKLSTVKIVLLVLL